MPSRIFMEVTISNNIRLWQSIISNSNNKTDDNKLVDISINE